MIETTEGDGLKLGSNTKFDAGQQSISNKIDNQTRIIKGEGRQTLGSSLKSRRKGKKTRVSQ